MGIEAVYTPALGFLHDQDLEQLGNEPAGYGGIQHQGKEVDVFLINVQ